MLVEQLQLVESGAAHRHKEMIPAAGSILDAQLGCIRERALEQRLQGVARHARDGSRAYANSVDELGLFPLGMVLLPTERAPLHIFEPRYRDLIGECLELERDFGVILADDDGLHDVGTRAAVLEVLERFPDGRVNIVVEGRQRFRVQKLTTGRSFTTAEVEPLVDEEIVTEQADREHALGLYRKLGDIVGAEIEEPDPDSGLLSFELAARVDFGVDRKQELLEQRSEVKRLRIVSELLERAAEAVTLERALAERASKNGSGVSGR